MSNGWLLDTNVLSELRRPRPEPRVLAFIADQPLERLYTSVVSIAEIRFGIERLTDPLQRDVLNAWLTHQVRPMFEQRVLPVCEHTMLRWRLLVEDGRKQGHTFSQPDLILAATALHHHLTLVTRNVADYARTSVLLRNPWSDT